VIGAVLGHPALSGVPLGRVLRILLEGVRDALGAYRGLIMHPARAKRADPQGAALVIGDDGGLLGVLLLLARDEGAPSRLVRSGTTHLDLGAVQPDRKSVV